MSDAVPPWRTFSSAGSPKDTDLAATATDDDPTEEAADTARTVSQTGGDRRSVVASLVRSADRWTLSLVAIFAIGSAALGALSMAMLVSLVGLEDGGTAGHDLTSVGLPLEGFDQADAFGDDVGRDSDQPPELVIDVAGGVATPGLHRLRPGDRVGDAIAAAGGFAPRADLQATSRLLNLAAPLSDGSKVLVPELGSGSRPTEREDGRIDLNRADGTTLESLPGVGPVTAQRIIDARGEARFGKITELRSRGVVGDAVYERLKELVRAGP